MGPTVGAQKAFGGVKSRNSTKTSGSFHRTQRGHTSSLKKALRLLQSVPTHCHAFFQIVGSRLRIPQVTPADSGEYVCHVSNGVGSQETSLIVTIESRGPSHGENVTWWARAGTGSVGETEVPPSIVTVI